MKVYDVFYKGEVLKPMRVGLTEAQVDEFWKSLEWWHKQSIVINEREIEDDLELDEER